MSPSAKVPRRPMTELERLRALGLGVCSFSIASFAKRFARGLRAEAMIGDKRITEKQAAMLEQMCWTFRRQLDPSLVPPRNPKGTQSGPRGGETP